MPHAGPHPAATSDLWPRHRGHRLLPAGGCGRGRAGPRWPAGWTSSRWGGLPAAGSWRTRRRTRGRARAAAATATRRWPGRRSASPASRQTCTEPALHIIGLPHGPARSKNSSIAAYRGTSSTRCGRRSGSTPPRSGTGQREDCLTEGGEIAAGDVHAGGEALRWRGTDLHLPAGLCGKTAATRERARRAQPGEGGGHSLLIDAETGVSAIADQPFQFDPDPAGRAGLEAYPVDVLFGVALGQRLPAGPSAGPGGCTTPGRLLVMSFAPSVGRSPVSPEKLTGRH